MTIEIQEFNFTNGNVAKFYVHTCKDISGDYKAGLSIESQDNKKYSLYIKTHDVVGRVENIKYCPYCKERLKCKK